MTIKTIDNKEKLKEVFDFLSRTFYEEAIIYNEHYNIMLERYAEMKEQFEKDNTLLLYIEEEKKIIGALTTKGMDLIGQNITLGVMAVARDKRGKGYAQMLIEEFERRCLNKGIKHINLGARFKACPLYLRLNYKPKLMVQVFDFATTKDIDKANTLGLEKEFEIQNDAYGFAFFKVDNVDEQYILHFKENVPNSESLFVFNKEL